MHDPNSATTTPPSSSPAQRPGRRYSGRQLLAMALLLLGIGICAKSYPYSRTFSPGFIGLSFHFTDDAFVERIILMIAVGLAAWPKSLRLTLAISDRLKSPSHRARGWIGWGIFLGSAGLLYLLARVRGRMLLPIWHDQNCYRLQTTFVAHGRLWQPALPLPEFFDVRNVFTTPVYAPAYFPGTAMLNAPGVWLHLPYYFIPLLTAAAILTLTYLIIVRLINGMAGLLSVLMIVSLMMFRFLALQEMSHSVGLMLGMLVLWCWLKWRESNANHWTAIAGLAAGWHLITRPLDCLCLLAPVAVAWGIDIWQRPWKARLSAAAIVIIAASPFLLVQIAFNHAVTGRWTQTPLDLYNRIYLNAKSIGLQTFDPDYVPPSMSRQVIDVYNWIDREPLMNYTTVRDAVDQFIRRRIRYSFGTALPSLLLITLVPASVLALRDRRRRVLWAVYPAFMIGTSLFYVMHRQYVMAVFPSVAFIVLLGREALAEAFPSKGRVGAFLTLAIVGLSVHRLWTNNQREFENLDNKVWRTNYYRIPALVKPPALVFCRYSSREHSLDEPVYNWDVDWPDDAPIIRAHDLGPVKDRELVHYYAEHQPSREVWLFDRLANSVIPLGNVVELDQSGAAISPRAASGGGR